LRVVQQHAQHRRVERELVDTVCVDELLRDRAAELAQQHDVATDVEREQQADDAGGV
jgi:hypothetical protein